MLAVAFGASTAESRVRRDALNANPALAPVVAPALAPVVAPIRCVREPLNDATRSDGRPDLNRSQGPADHQHPHNKALLGDRYAWANSSEGANLYNGDGLPTAPFRTDSWNATKPVEAQITGK